jgi:hypothetical protein
MKMSLNTSIHSNFYPEQLSTTRSFINEDETILSLMHNMLMGYRTFLSSLRRQLNLTLTFLVTNLIREERKL